MHGSGGGGAKGVPYLNQQCKNARISVVKCMQKLVGGESVQQCKKYCIAQDQGEQLPPCPRYGPVEILENCKRPASTKVNLSMNCNLVPAKVCRACTSHTTADKPTNCNTIIPRHSHFSIFKHHG